MSSLLFINHYYITYKYIQHFTKTSKNTHLKIRLRQALAKNNTKQFDCSIETFSL